MNKRFIVKNYLGTGEVIASFDTKEEADIYCITHETEEDCPLWWDTEGEYN